MAEAFGVAAGSLTVLELTTKVIKQCRALIETAHDAPRDLRHIFIEISSLKAVLESFEFLSRSDFSDTAQSLAGADGVVEGCRKTVEELSKELDGLSIANTSHVAPGKRQKIMGSLQWCLKESKTRKLLDETVQHKTTLTLALLGEITSDVKEIKSSVERVHDRLTKTERREVCQWIEHTNPTSIHHQSCRNHEEHTCQWVHRVDQWKDWLHLQRRLIWIHGIPGAGKTVLASYLIQQTVEYCAKLSNDRAVCLYYYCSFRHGQEERRDEAIPFLRWIVSQLCRRSDQIPSNLLPLYRQNSTPSIQALKEALQALLVCLDVLYIVVDAADESNPRTELLGLIQDIISQPNYGKIQLLITSRRYADIEEVLRPLSEPTLQMSNSIVDADIRTFVGTTVQRNKYFAKWSANLRQEVLESLVQGAQGMFRWVVCQIDRLQRKSPQQAKEAIRCLPQTLEETYETIFLEIPQEDWDTARTALQWISGHSDLAFSHGIPANCLSSAVLSTHHISGLDVGGFVHEHEFLNIMLGCLIELNSAADSVEDPRWNDRLWPSMDADSAHTCFHTVSLAHYTIEEFLFSDRLNKSKVSFFAMSRDTCAQKMLETVLQPLSEANLSCLSPRAYSSFEAYCYTIARGCPSSWGTLILRKDTLWHQYYNFFAKHRYSWHELFCLEHDASKFIEKRGHFKYEPTDDPTIIKIQYLIAILELNSVDMLNTLLAELSLEATLSILVPLKLIFLTPESADKLRHITVLDALEAVCTHVGPNQPYHDLLESLNLKMDPSKLLLFYMSVHTHGIACSDSCVIVGLIDAGADINFPGCLLTPLQIAVRNWDYRGVQVLLEYGADPDGTGQPGGYIPTHIDAAWAHFSPLHILRNADYGLMTLEYFLGLKAKRALDRPKIEALLLEYNAKDFVSSGPVEGRRAT